MIKKFEVEKDFHNTRFDRWFKNKVLDIPQGLIEKIIRKNQVKVNKKKLKVLIVYKKTILLKFLILKKLSIQRKILLHNTYPQILKEISMMISLLKIMKISL